MTTASPDGGSVTDGQLRMAVCLVLAAVTLAVFWNLQHHNFIRHDDPSHVIFNPHVQSGLTGGGLIWTLTTFEFGTWHPLTWNSLMLDYEIFHFNPVGYQWTNLISVLSEAVLTVLALSSWQQVRYWRNSVTLFEYVLSVTSGNYLAHNNLGVALSLAERTEVALRHYSAALLIKPDYADAHNNIGVALAAQGKYREAIYCYSDIVLKPCGPVPIMKRSGQPWRLQW
jgi:hypothetical protein